jgi:uncharacterized membrane protein YhaH (DUF805 family)
MRAALRYHFKHLLAFYGRDSRQTFWYWFLFVFILNMIASFITTLSVMMDAVTAGYDVAKGGDEVAAQTAMLSQMAVSIKRVIMVSLAVGLVNVVLMAAPLVRRMHDSGNTGLWAIVAAAIYLLSLALTWLRADDSVALMRRLATASDPQTVFGLQSHFALDGLIGYVPLIIVIAFGLLKSTPGPNCYAERPVRF